MNSTLVASLFACAVACTRGASPPTDVGRDAAASSASPGAPSPSAPAPATNAELQKLCGAEGLPAIDERVVPAERLLRAAERGTVALHWDGSHAVLSEGCALPGSYTELPGSGGGRFFGTNRVLLRPDEVPASCREATHLVASFATWRAVAGEQLGAILVPLPCPSVADPAPAAGCIGAGLSGSERAARAKEAAERLGATRDEVWLEPGQGLGVFALAPDDYFGVAAVRRLYSVDRGLGGQARWLSSQYVLVQERSDEEPRLLLPPATQPMWIPRHDQYAATRGHALDSLAMPAFTFCFTAHFKPDWDGPWKPLERKP